MICDRARGLFGACWDDELTQAEKEWLEAHFSSCARCRAEYDDYSRALELAGSLPRVEARADFVDRVLARAHRASATPDRLGEVRTQWLPVAAAAAASALLVAALFVLPRAPWRGPAEGGPERMASRPVASAPALPGPKSLARPGLPAVAVKLPERRSPQSAAAAVIPDSLFDHSEDVDFILDPVAIRRGHASMTHGDLPGTSVRGQQALITF